jgi:hypothetical protein
MPAHKPAPEPDLDAILPLLYPASYANPHDRRADWERSRDAAAVALAWLCGLRPFQMRATLRRGDGARRRRRFRACRGWRRRPQPPCA